jgi:hypothetical protein
VCSADRPGGKSQLRHSLDLGAAAWAKVWRRRYFGGEQIERIREVEQKLQAAKEKA